MIMTKEPYEAWIKMQNFIYEINLCIKYQIGWGNISDEDALMRMDVFDKILNELTGFEE